MIQNFEDRKFADSKQDQMNAQEEPDTKTKPEVEKDKVDILVDAMQNHSTTDR